MRVTRWLSLQIVRVALALMASATFAAASLAGEPSPGRLIRAEAMPDAPEGARAYRILYWSTGLDGKPVEVSGVVIAPRGAPQPGGRPVIAWAHPTTGVISRCAPSLARVFFGSVQGLRAMLDRGYVVAATDYPGLGTPEVHPYLVGTSEAHAALNSVRAAQQIPEAARRSTFRAYGAIRRAGRRLCSPASRPARYAPELKLVGVAAACACDRSDCADDRRSRDWRRQHHHRHDALVVGARLWRADGQGGSAASRAGHRPPDEALHRALVRHVSPVADQRRALEKSFLRVGHLARSRAMAAPSGRELAWAFAGGHSGFSGSRVGRWPRAARRHRGLPGPSLPEREPGGVRPHARGRPRLRRLRRRRRRGRLDGRALCGRAGPDQLRGLAVRARPIRATDAR